MFVPVIILFISFIIVALVDNNFMLARWIWGTYVVPTFYPTVINCNTSDDPLAVVYTLNTLEKRRHVLVLFIFSLQAIMLCVCNGCYPWIDPAIMFSIGLWVFYKRPKTAILMESMPYSGKSCTFKQFIKDKEDTMTEEISKQLASYIRAGPTKETIVKALHSSQFDKEKALQILQQNKPIDDEEPHPQDYLIREYQTKTYDSTEYDIKTSQTQQVIYKSLFYDLAKRYQLNLKNVSFVTGNASMFENNYCGPCRIPPRSLPDNNFMQRDFEEIDTYESWFDTHCANKKFMSIFSYGPLNTVSYGVTSSPNTRVCLFSQSSCWETNGFYERSKNTMANPTAAKAIIDHAWVTLQIPDDYVLRTEHQIVSYMGSSTTEAVETIEFFHGSIDNETSDYLKRTVDRGAFPLYDDVEETMVMPNFVTAAILLHPWSVLYQMVTNKRSFDTTFLPFCQTCYSEPVEKTWTDGDIFTLAYNKCSFRALDRVVMQQTFSTDPLPKIRPEYQEETTEEEDSADDADSETSSAAEEEDSVPDNEVGKGEL